jgi:hypothetical protein
MLVMAAIVLRFAYTGISEKGFSAYSPENVSWTSLLEHFLQHRPQPMHTAEKNVKS